MCAYFVRRIVIFKSVIFSIELCNFFQKLVLVYFGVYGTRFNWYFNIFCSFCILTVTLYLYNPEKLRYTQRWYTVLKKYKIEIHVWYFTAYYKSWLVTVAVDTSHVVCEFLYNDLSNRNQSKSIYEL